MCANECTHVLFSALKSERPRDVPRINGAFVSVLGQQKLNSSIEESDQDGKTPLAVEISYHLFSNTFLGSKREMFYHVT